MADLHIDENLYQTDSGEVRCVHCNTTVGERTGPYLGEARWVRRPASEAGPHIRNHAAQLVGRRIVLRQAFCPSCLVALHTEVLPDDEESLRVKRI
jgi:N-methylhydantoinase B